MNKEKKAVSRHSLSFRARIKKRVVFDSATQLGIERYRFNQFKGTRLEQPQWHAFNHYLLQVQLYTCS